MTDEQYEAHARGYGQIVTGQEMTPPSLAEYAATVVKPDPLAQLWSQIVSARAQLKPVSWPTIVKWLRDVHGIVIAESTLKRRYNARG
jgi:hypothetical protein